MSTRQQQTQVRDISDSRPDGLQLALNRAGECGFYAAFMLPWGNFTRVVFRRHPDTDSAVELPNAERLSRRMRGDGPAEEPTLLETLEGLMEIAEEAMPDSYFQSDSRTKAGRAAIEVEQEVQR